jgi:Uma2 family endonuclease
VRFKNEQNEEDTVVQPDLLIICDPSKIDEKGCSGAPDLIVEILSPATAGKDLKEKFKLYESHGVKEYWVIEPHNKILFFYSLNKKGIYDRPEIYNEDDTVQSRVVPGIEIKLDKIFQ